MWVPGGLPAPGRGTESCQIWGIRGSAIGDRLSCLSLSQRGVPPGVAALKIAWNAVLGRLGGLGREPGLEEGKEDEEEWLDLETERAEEIKRKERILKGQLARAAARSREGLGSSSTLGEDGEDVSMSTRNSLGGGEGLPGKTIQKDKAATPVSVRAKRGRMID